MLGRDFLGRSYGPEVKTQRAVAGAGCGVIEESLAAGFLVSELVCKSVFNCGQIRGRENTKDLWGLQRCCKPEPLTCQQQIRTSSYHLVLLSFLGGEEQESVFGRVGIAGMALTGAFPWAGRVDVEPMGGTGWERREGPCWLHGLVGRGLSTSFF